MDIYQNQSKIKWFIFGAALVLGILSLIYNNWLARQLAARERKQIDLFAKTQELIATPENSNNLNFLITEIIEANASIPVVLADENQNPIDYKNLDFLDKFSDEVQQEKLKEEIGLMQEQYEPIEVQLGEDWKQFIFYMDSPMITQLRYYPYIQLSVIATVALLAYFMFSMSKRSEQNRVWVGLAKETAHQLGTPISSLMAWIEYFQSDPTYPDEITQEIEKDVARLQMITARFSSIGSEPSLHRENIISIIKGIVSYLEKRVSRKVQINVTPKRGQDMHVPLNIPLFEWVIENLCKNAVDAMEGAGRIDIYLRHAKDQHLLQMDICDTGKGISRSKLKTVFQPGYTTKKRGWGLGLALVKRIVENYHKGKIFVKKSDASGTTFRILLPRD